MSGDKDGERPGSVRAAIERAIAEHETKPERQPPESTTKHSTTSFPWDDVVVLSCAGLIAEPFCHVGADLLMHSETIKGFIAFAIGVPFGIAGATFHWWKRRLNHPAYQWFVKTSDRLWPVALLFVFLWLIGVFPVRQSSIQIPSANEIASAVTSKLDAQPKIAPAVPSSTTVLSQPKSPNRSPKDAEKEIEVIDQISGILRGEATAEVEKASQLTTGWWNGLVDPANNPNYFQDFDTLHDGINATTQKIHNILLNAPQYCDDDLCVIVDERKNETLMPNLDNFNGAITTLRDVDAQRKGNDAIWRLMLPFLDRAGNVIAIYRDWIKQTGDSLLSRRKELSDMAGQIK